MLLKELDSAYCNSGGDSIKTQLGCHVGYFGNIRNNNYEVMVYLLVKII